MNIIASLIQIYQWTMGEQIGGVTFYISRWMFLRILALIYFVAFASLSVQIKDLVGIKGPLPYQPFLGRVKEKLGHKRFHQFPTLFWFCFSGQKDIHLMMTCYAGMIISVFLFLGVAPLPCLILLWVLYLSLVNVGQDFLSYQWDVLLLEVGLMSVFLAPVEMFPFWRELSPVPPLAILFQWWILFRLMLESGVVKLRSGDDSWRRGEALSYHYETQPLPNRWSHFFHQLPRKFQRLSTRFVLFLELVAPCFVFFPPFFRYGAGLGLFLLQALIMITGNFAFFNILTSALILLLFDDSFWEKILPPSLVEFSVLHFSGAPTDEVTAPYLFVVLWMVAALVVAIGCMQILQSIIPHWRPPGIYSDIWAYIRPFRSINSYGPYRVMTRTRREIIIQGSVDGRHWKDYELWYKPGDLYQRPRQVAPHQPRLDWQFWFAALSSHRHHPWFQELMIQLLKAPSKGFFKYNPFPDHPPRFVRALSYRYKFADRETRLRTGQWWVREDIQIYFPVISLPDGDGRQEDEEGRGSGRE